MQISYLIYRRIWRREEVIIHMNEFLTWEFLSTFAGAALATGILTQCLKSLFARVPTQIVSYVIALVVLVGATAASGASGWADWAILPLNAVLVSLAANGAYAAVVRIRGDVE